MKQVLVVACALIDIDERVLIAQRPKDKEMPGLWEFPGGKIENGESPEQAIARELEEELGINVKGACLAPLTFASHSYENFHLLMPLFICRKWHGEPVAKEHQAIKWVRANRLGQYAMPAADEPLIAHLCDLL